MKSTLRIIPCLVILAWILTLFITGISYRLFFQEEREMRIQDLENQFSTIQKLDEYHSTPPYINTRRALIAISVSKKFYVPLDNEDFFPSLIKQLKKEGWDVNDSDFRGTNPSLLVQKGIYILTIGVLLDDPQYNWSITIRYDDIFEKINW